MSEFMRRLSEATGSSSGFTPLKKQREEGRVLEMLVSAGRSLGEITAEIDTFDPDDYPVLDTDAASARAFAAELGKRFDAAGLKQDKGNEVVISGDKHEDWLTVLDAEAKNGLSAEIYVYADRKTGKKLTFEIQAIGPDASGYNSTLPSNDPLKLWTKGVDLLDALQEAALVAKGHAEDVLAFRKLDPDFGKGK